MGVMEMTFLALLGVGVVGAWYGLMRSLDDKPAPRHRQPPAAFLVPATRPETTPAIPRIQRRGFGSHLAQTPPRRRTWSPFAYSGMWSELHR